MAARVEGLRARHAELTARRTRARAGHRRAARRLAQLEARLAIAGQGAGVEPDAVRESAHAVPLILVTLGLVALPIGLLFVSCSAARPLHGLLITSLLALPPAFGALLSWPYRRSKLMLIASLVGALVFVCPYFVAITRIGAIDCNMCGL